ncbi:CvpA family protein [Puteibacter caeruleilacunae]|nr:CvpA family protein [Puteibacter caeruleilacunae]
MNYIDLIIGIILVIAAGRGLFKGLVYEVSSLAALILGVWGAIKFSDYTANLIIDVFNYNPKYLNIIAFIVTLLVIVWLVHVIGTIIDKLLSAVALGPLNRLLGLIFAVFKSAFFISVVILILHAVKLDDDLMSKEARRNSYLYTPVEKLAPRVFSILNIDVYEIMGTKKDEKPAPMV